MYIIKGRIGFYYVRENDVDDQNKKTNNCKVYAGYIVAEFKLNKEIIYKIQTDFLDFQGNDIGKRISCIKESINTLK